MKLAILPVTAVPAELLADRLREDASRRPRRPRRRDRPAARRGREVRRDAGEDPGHPRPHRPLRRRRRARRARPACRSRGRSARTRSGSTSSARRAGVRRPRRAAASRPTAGSTTATRVTVGDDRASRSGTAPATRPGHVVFVHRELGIAFVGDVLFQGSIGRTDFPRGDLDTLIASITGRAVAATATTCSFVPGHGPMSTFGDERRDNPYVGDEALGVPRRSLSCTGGQSGSRTRERAPSTIRVVPLPTGVCDDLRPPAAPRHCGPRSRRPLLSRREPDRRRPRRRAGRAAVRAPRVGGPRRPAGTRGRCARMGADAHPAGRGPAGSGQPYARLAAILGGVALFTAVSALVFRSRQLRGRFGLG